MNKKVIYTASISIADFIATALLLILSFFLLNKPSDFSLNVLYTALIISGVKVGLGFVFGVYKLLWMYGLLHNFIRLFIVACSVNLVILLLFLIDSLVDLTHVSFQHYLISVCMEFVYLVISRFLVYIFLTKVYKSKEIDKRRSINTLIIGAGNAGAMVLSEYGQSKEFGYKFVGFVDDSKDKIGTTINGVKVYGPIERVNELAKELSVEKIIIAIPSAGVSRIKEVTNLIKYDKSITVEILPDKTKLLKNQVTTSIRKVGIGDLLGRKPLDVISDDTYAFYRDKVVLITGGGGSIGSELCRQVAKMSPKQIIILDIYENCAYDIQQELKMKYGDKINLQVEIISITNRPALERVFANYRPNIVVMAAAHKHVPLMEHNVVEAVENNVFGTLNTVELAEKYGVDRVHMVSTDKAVNPTSVMGATKRICEMIVQSHSTIKEHTTFSATRFGNVLGSAGSVIPLFKRQIEAGGPVTLTDYRIIRYFMTIPEASQLVLQSASMAKNGELFVLDMGEPVKIYDLAKNMIRLSGFIPDVDIKIIETGLRPGEKLYEELLVKTEELDKTENSMIFIERDKPLELDKVDVMLSKLKKGVDEGDDVNMKNIIKEVVPTFIEKEEANKVIKKGIKVK